MAAQGDWSGFARFDVGRAEGKRFSRTGGARSVAVTLGTVFGSRFGLRYHLYM